jgi:hypothetical protein
LAGDTILAAANHSLLKDFEKQRTRLKLPLCSLHPTSHSTPRHVDAEYIISKSVCDRDSDHHSNELFQQQHHQLTHRHNSIAIDSDQGYSLAILSST